jgi:hypothetical protein
MANATPRMDGADFSAQLLLSVLLNTEPPSNFLDLSRRAFQVQLGWWAQLNAALDSFKTDTPPTHPLLAYEGDYFNDLRNFKIVVRSQDTGLRVSIQDKPLTTYDLKPCDEDTFYWAADREHEIVDRGMWFNPLPQYHLVHFNVDGKGVRSLAWQHDRLMDAEVFSKIIEEEKAKM